MKSNYIVYLLILIINISCNKSEINTFKNQVKIADYKVIFSDKNDPFGEITDIEIIDSILIVKNMNDKYYFSFINKNSGKQIKRWGSKGRGPNEYTQLGSGFSISDKKLIFLDGLKKEINYVPISEIIKETNDLKIVKEIYPYTNNFRPKDLNIINDKKVAIGAFEKGRFGVLDTKNNIFECPSEYPFKYEEIKGIYQGSVFQSKIKSSKEHSKFVIQTFSSDIFEIYQISNDSISKIYVTPFNHKPQITKRTNRNYAVDSYKSIAGLMNMAVSDELVCFTYSSENYIDARNSNFISDEILCFNWNGEKVKKYILPFPISKFCIDKKNIYGVRYHKDETIIYQFSL